MVAGQKIALGRLDRHRTVTVTVSETTLAIDLGYDDVKVVRRTTTQPVPSVKGQRPRIACGVQIPRQGHDLGIGRGLSDDGVLKMNEFKVKMHGP
jgi:hypothetical protein